MKTQGPIVLKRKDGKRLVIVPIRDFTFRIIDLDTRTDFDMMAIFDGVKNEK